MSYWIPVTMMEIQEGVIKDVVLIDTVTQYDDFDI